MQNFTLQVAVHGLLEAQILNDGLIGNIKNAVCLCFNRQKGGHAIRPDVNALFDFSSDPSAKSSSGPIACNIKVLQHKNYFTKPDKEKIVREIARHLEALFDGKRKKFLIAIEDFNQYGNAFFSNL